MSQRLPRWTAKELVRFLKKQGFVEISQSGSHLHLMNPQTKKRTTVPIHVGRIIGLGLMKTILSQAGISLEEL